MNAPAAPLPPVPRPRPRRRLLAAAKTLVAGALVLAAGVGWAGRPVRARSAPVERGEVRVEATGVGTIESDELVTLAFVAPGRVASLAVDEGDRVRAGQVIATLDVADTMRQLGVARAGEGAASTAIARARADVARAEAARAAAQKDLVRTRALRAEGSVAEASLDAAVERADRSDAELAAARAAVVQAEASASAAREGTGLVARRLDDGRLVSPVDGVVLERKHVVGDVVGAGTAVLVVASTRKVRARAWIDETALGALREGADAAVVLRSAAGAPLRGRVERVGAAADRQTHEVLVDVELVDRPARIAFGQRADVSIVLDRRDAALRVPAGFCDVPAKSCLVERDGRAARVPVTFGLVGLDAVEVASGLAQGDAVIAPLAGAPALAEGRRVRRAP
jgi:RND family efflux transporter MFP subunit